MKQQRERSDKVRGVSYLWGTIPKKEQDHLLLSAGKKLARLEALTKRKPRPDTSLPRILPTLVASNDMMADLEMVTGLTLDDGWYRICCLHKWEGLCIHIRERLEDSWLEVYSKTKAAMDMNKVWPFHARSKANPWRWPSVYEVQTLLVRWSEEFGQYKVTFQFGPGVTQTFWFPPEFKDCGVGEGWVTPRYIGKFQPL